MPPATKSTSGGEPSKRRKTSSSAVAESGGGAGATRIDRVSLHAAVTKLEDEEVKSHWLCTKCAVLIHASSPFV